MEERNALGKSVSLGHFGVLEGNQYMSLSTFRKDGAAVATPVWFSQDGERLFVTTLEGTGKVKRLLSNPAVTVAPCDRRGRLLGAAVEGRARVLPESEERPADRSLATKYGLVYRGFGVVRSVVARRARRVFIEVSVPEAAPQRRQGS